MKKVKNRDRGQRLCSFILLTLREKQCKFCITMAVTTNLNIRIDKDLKERAEAFFGELGFNMTTAINIFVRQSLREGKIPFEISIVPDPFYSPSNMATLRRSIQEANEGKLITKTFGELRAMEE